MDKQELLQIYRQMLLMRRFEDRAGVAYMQDKVGGYIHLYIGQEAVGCGLVSVLQKGDVVISSYRDHGHFLAVGGGIDEAMAELYGKDGGCSRGKGGSMHLFSKEHGFYGGSGIVGAGIGIGTGLGFALKYRKQPNVCLCFFGDGAAQTGLFHESMNVASLWGLPVVFVIENNHYAMGTSVQRSSSETELYKRAGAYNIHGERVDGMDLFAVREVAERVIPQVRETQRPVLLEAVTYRYRGHGGADPARYRTKEELEEWQKRDPIGIVEAKILDEEMATREEVARWHAEAHAEVEKCLRFAEESPFPAAEELYTHVYA